MENPYTLSPRSVVEPYSCCGEIPHFLAQLLQAAAGAPAKYLESRGADPGPGWPGDCTTSGHAGDDDHDHPAHLL